MVTARAEAVEQTGAFAWAAAARGPKTGSERGGARELTGFSPRIDRIFPSSISKLYLKG